MKKETLYKYYVVKLENPPNKCLSKYLCVRRSWTNKIDEDTKVPNISSKNDYGRVQAWYPFEMSSKRVKSNLKPDLKEGVMYIARVKYKTDIYKDAKAWIFLMQKSEKHKSNNEQNAPMHEITAEKNSTGGDQSSNEEELSSTSESFDKQNQLLEISVPADLVIDENSKDDEPVTSSSSPNNIQIDFDVQQQDDIAVCLLKYIQSLLKEVEKVRKEQLRFEFDEVRIVRVCDNNILDRLPKLTINVDGISCGVNATDDLLPPKQRAEVVTTRTKTSEAPEAPTSSSVPVVIVPQGSSSDQSFNSMRRAESRPEYQTPSNRGTAHTELPSSHAEQHTLPVNALRHIASLSQNYTAPASTSSNTRSLSQNYSSPMANNSPYVTIQPSYPLSYHPSHQFPVFTPVISSATNSISKQENVGPAVTVRSPDEINKRVMSGNSNPISYGANYPPNLGIPMYIPNATSDNRLSSEFPSSERWVTPAVISPMAMMNGRTALQNPHPTMPPVYSPDDINKRISPQNSSNVTLQLANHLNRHYLHQNLATPAFMSSMAMTNVRPVPQDSHAIMDPVYSADEINKRLAPQNSSNVTLQLANRLNNRRSSHQHSVPPTFITPMAPSRSIPQSSGPIVSSDVITTSKYFNTLVGSDPSFPLYHNSSTRNGTSESNDVFTSQKSSTSNAASIASYNDYFVRSVIQNLSNPVLQSYNSPIDVRSADLSGNRKYDHTSLIRQRIAQNKKKVEKKIITSRHTTLQKENRKTRNTVVID